MRKHAATPYYDPQAAQLDWLLRAHDYDFFCGDVRRIFTFFDIIITHAR